MEYGRCTVEGMYQREGLFDGNIKHQKCLKYTAKQIYLLISLAVPSFRWPMYICCWCYMLRLHTGGELTVMYCG